MNLLPQKHVKHNVINSSTWICNENKWIVQNPLAGFFGDILFKS